MRPKDEVACPGEQLVEWDGYMFPLTTLLPIYHATGGHMMPTPADGLHSVTLAHILFTWPCRPISLYGNGCYIPGDVSVGEVLRIHVLTFL